MDKPIDTTRFGESLCVGNVRVDWVELGEGKCGEYDETDPDDVEFLRFDVYEFDPLWNGLGYEGWRPIDDASYCTLFPVEASDKQKQAALEFIMEGVQYFVENGQSIKKICEKLSWIEPVWLLGLTGEHK